MTPLLLSRQVEALEDWAVTTASIYTWAFIINANILQQLCCDRDESEKLCCQLVQHTKSMIVKNKQIDRL